MKILINRCFGGFGLSQEALNRYGVRFNSDLEESDRTNEKLIAIVEEMGSAAEGYSSRIKIAEIPDAVTDWMLEEYDGMERVLYVVDGMIHVTA